MLDLPFHGCHVVTGGPGTGKTVMAVFRAWALATAGRKVALLTRSNLLHQYLGQTAPDLTEAVEVTTYHRWVRAFWRSCFRNDVPRVGEDHWTYDWGEMQRICLLEKTRWPAHLVIDEGQALPLGFYELCRFIGVEVTVFADENQRIDDEQSTLSEMCRTLALPDGPLTLRENRRNSRGIAELAYAYRTRARQCAPLPERVAPTPVLLKVSSVGEFLTGVAQYFRAHPRRTIGIICRTTHLLRSVHSELTHLGLAEHTQTYVHDDEYRNAMDFTRRHVRVVTTASMKGLEFDSVFVPDLDAYTEDPTGAESRLRFLVLCTRAREDLYLAFRGTQEPAVVADVPEALLERRDARRGPRHARHTGSPRGRR
ncbi:AAA family ATPase [Streptomyces albus]|uniref:AAA family ATPase n=1 Tax=Streptomyces albus TaxID=1888 RepID=UPI0034512549